jgi:cyclophilin family peptidyl-prolyl cis-trans isomerase
MPNPIATFDTTMGAFKAEIFLDQMPITASNFMCAPLAAPAAMPH